MIESRMYAAMSSASHIFMIEEQTSRLAHNLFLPVVLSPTSFFLSFGQDLTLQMPAPNEGGGFKELKILFVHLLNA